MRQNKAQRQEQILKAMKEISTRKARFACFALGHTGDLLREEFNDLFKDPDQGFNWTFFSLPDGSNELPYPSIEECINVRLTALWFFYHMQ